MYLIPIMCFQIYQVVPEGEMLADLKEFCRFICNTSGIGLLGDFLLNGKDYHENEASWELENEFRETYPNFVIVDTDLI